MYIAHTVFTDSHLVSIQFQPIMTKLIGYHINSHDGLEIRNILETFIAKTRTIKKFGTLSNIIS